MAVLVSIARGHSACYPFTTVGAADGATITGERGVGYYLSVVEKVGEPAGTWVGNGAAELGFHDRDTVRREDFRRAAARPGAHLARRRARDTARPRANRPAGGTDAKARRGTRRDTRAGLGRTAGWLHSHSELTHAQERAAMAAGLAQVQEARSAWTRADLVHAIVQNLPDHANSQDQEATSPTACAGRTRRASTGPGGQAVRHPAQLSIGQQLLADAYAEGAPQFAYEQAAALLGVGHRWSDSHAIGDLIMALAFTRAMMLAVASTAAY